MKVLENNGYKMKVRSDEGNTLLIAQRCYTEKGVSMSGRPYFKAMVWMVFGWCSGRKYNIQGFNPTMKSKQEVLDAIKDHPSFTVAAHELGLK